jgi:hypothetical protein
MPRRKSDPERDRPSQSPRTGVSADHEHGRDERTEPGTGSPVATLHGALGNQAVQRLHEGGRSNGPSPADREREREARRVADRVVRSSPAESITATETEGASPSRPATEGTTLNRGTPLPGPVRSFFEPRFGRTFGDVRVHTDAAADDAAGRLHAEAFTYGTDIAFRRGAFDPASEDGRRLLAHELAHVVQQRATGVGTVQRQESTGSRSHPEKPSPSEYVDRYTGLFGLDETGLGRDLFTLVWQSARHGSFVESVLAELGSDDREQVAWAFAVAAKRLGSLADLGESGGGRTALEAVARALPRSGLRIDVEEAVEEGPQRLRERQREAAQAELNARPGSESVSFYPETPDDAAEGALQSDAERKEEAGRTLAFGIAEFGAIGRTLESMAAEREGPFVRELILMGHGSIVEGEGVFKAGDRWVRTSDLERYDTGQFAAYVMSGATIHFQACTIARGEAGKRFLREVGRIFFGEEKRGYLKGNTEDAPAMIGVGPAKPRTLRWPQDF